MQKRLLGSDSILFLGLGVGFCNIYFVKFHGTIHLYDLCIFL